jgi:5'-3' exonuclease
VTRRTILGDADIFAFKYTSANQKNFLFDGPDEAPAIEASFEDAIAGVSQYIEDLKVLLGADEVVICLSDPDANFRKDVYPKYKSHRDYSEGARPVYLKAVKEWFKTEFKTYQRPGLEADDCMGILATHPTLVKGEKVIVSEDKDMKTIPGLLFNPKKDSKPQRISKLDADRFHLWQTVVGDTCDGYPGAKGVGPASAEAKAILVSKTVEEMWTHALAAFKRKGFTEADAIVQARCARILRAADWDFESKRPRLWSPPRLD